MGRQGGIARFTGSVGNLNCYFDAGMEIVRTKSPLNKKKWLQLPSMRRQRNAAKVFGAASTVAAQLWKPLPAPMRRLADGAAYGRLVGECSGLMAQDPHSEEPDLQLWDADELRGFNLNVDALGPHRVVISRTDGTLRLLGMDKLQAELDQVLDNAGNVKPQVCQVAHPFWQDGLCHEEEPRKAETEAFFTAQRTKDRVSASKHPQNVYRSRVWIHATEVADTKWSERDRKFKLQDDFRGFSNGFVSEWELSRQPTKPNSPNQAGEEETAIETNFAPEYTIEGRDWQTDWMGEGTYIIFAAVEVAVKRCRHWVRLPWCCKMEILDVVTITQSAIKQQESNTTTITKQTTPPQPQSNPLPQYAMANTQVQEKPTETIKKANPPNTRSFGQVGYKNANGQIIVVKGWPEIGREIKVWALEDLHPPALLRRRPPAETPILQPASG